METFSIHTRDEEQAKTVRAFLKALEIPFESSGPSPYDPAFVAKIREGEKQFKEGASKRIKREEELKVFLGIDD